MIMPAVTSTRKNVALETVRVGNKICDIGNVFIGSFSL